MPNGCQKKKQNANYNFMEDNNIFSRELPAELDVDLWSSIETKLDSVYHTELHDTDYSHMSVRSQFTLGLSGYVDGECPAQQSQSISEHLVECPTCRSYYLSFIKLRKAMLYAYKLPAELESADLWQTVSAELFPNKLRKAQ